ncbi:unnamed protein product, partial [Choristocarpus tenellus]
PKNLARRTFSTGGSIHDSAGEVEELLLSLEEVKNADNLALTGRHSEAVPFLQRAVEICTGSVGEESTLARAALRRLGQALYNAGQYTDAEAVFKREVKNGESTSVPALLLLSKSQLFQGRLSQAVEASSQAVALCEKHDDYTPDTDALGQALRQLGVTQMLHGAREDAETSLLRAARLGSTSMDQAKSWLHIMHLWEVSKRWRKPWSSGERLAILRLMQKMRTQAMLKEYRARMEVMVKSLSAWQSVPLALPRPQYFAVLHRESCCWERAWKAPLHA